MNAQHRLTRIGALALLLLTFLIPASAASAQTTDKEDIFGTGLGGSQANFEAKYGAPTDKSGAKDFATGVEYAVSGYKSVFVYWHKGFSAHIVLNARDGWPEKKAIDIANRFLPTDVHDAGDPVKLSDGSVLIPGRSATLAKRFSAATYKDLGVGGEQGDLRVVLIPNASGEAVGTVDIAIGIGKELKSTPVETPASSTPTPTAKKKSTGEAAYLKAVRKNVDALQKSLDDFTAILQRANAGTSQDSDQTDLAAILINWQSAPDDAAALTPPSGFEDLQTAYESAAKDLSGASSDMIKYSSTSDDSLLDSAIAKLTSAKTELQQADQMLTDAGY